ncbi:MAG TPA: hypothetical protein VIJ12_03865 [Candidatus Baltobacteraceae bacterium]
MKALREVYEFITGGSIAAPIGLFCAIVAALLTAPLPPGARAALFLAILLLTFVAATFERVT